MFYIWTFSFKSFQLYPIFFVVVVFPFLINSCQILSALYKKGHSLIDLNNKFLVIKNNRYKFKLKSPTNTHSEHYDIDAANQIIFFLLIYLVPVFGTGTVDLGPIPGCKVSDSSQLNSGFKGNL